MIKKHLKIKNIPAILWGEDSDNIFIAVHGNMSCRYGTHYREYDEMVQCR